MKVYFVTSNKDKILEAKSVFGDDLETYDLDLEEIQSMDIKKVAESKALEAYRIIGKPLFVEDTAAYLECMHGFPGPFVKWMLATAGTAGIAKIADRLGNARIVASVAVAFYDGKKMKAFSASLKGRVAKKPAGKEGFGFDFIFIPEGYSKTFAQLGREVKNRISPRSAALRKLKRHLEKLDT